jgi:hypothetical protein
MRHGTAFPFVAPDAQGRRYRDLAATALVTPSLLIRHPKPFIYAEEDGGFLDPANYLRRVLKEVGRDGQGYL